MEKNSKVDSDVFPGDMPPPAFLEKKLFFTLPFRRLILLPLFNVFNESHGLLRLLGYRLTNACTVALFRALHNSKRG